MNKKIKLMIYLLFAFVFLLSITAKVRANCIECGQFMTLPAYCSTSQTLCTGPQPRLHSYTGGQYFCRGITCVLDNAYPASSVNRIEPAPTQWTDSNYYVNTQTITFSWLGNDEAGGSGLKNYDAQHCVGDCVSGPWSSTISATTSTSASIGVTNGNKYCFRSLARDNANNLESKSTSDKCVVVDTNTISITSGPTILSTSLTGAKIMLWTSKTTKDTLYYGTSSSALTNTADGGTDTTHSVTLSGLSPGTTYYYKATSSYRNGASVSSEVKQFTTQADKTPPASSVNRIEPAPTQWTDSNYYVNTQTITFSWLGNDEAGGSGLKNYDAQHCVGDCVSGPWSSTISATTSTSASIGVTNGNKHCFRSLARDNANNLESKSTSDKCVVVDTNTISITSGPTILSTSLTGAKIMWWTSKTTKDTLYYGTSSSALTNTADGGTDTTHSVTLSGLSPGTTYYYKATSSYRNGASVSSEVKQFTTQADKTPPASSVNRIEPAPTQWTDSNYYVNTQTITFSWLGNDEAGGSGLKNYDAQHCVGDCVSGPWSSTISATTSTSASIGVTNGNKYCFRSLARDNANNLESKSTSDKCVVVDTNTISITSGPTILSTSLTGAKIMWWTSKTTKDTLYYGTSSSALTNTADGGTDTTHSATLSGLSPGTTYYYKATSSYRNGAS